MSQSMGGWQSVTDEAWASSRSWVVHLGILQPEVTKPFEIPSLFVHALLPATRQVLDRSAEFLRADSSDRFCDSGLESSEVSEPAPADHPLDPGKKEVIRRRKVRRVGWLCQGVDT